MKTSVATTFTNEQRTRHYGLRIGDLVSVRLSNSISIDAEVVGYAFWDNNRVMLRFLNGNSAGSVEGWVAEWCKLKEKCEDRFPEYNSVMGKQVKKMGVLNPVLNTKKQRATKPFKSGNKINTVNGIINHPILNIPAYTFVEDDSYVECRRCEII